MEKQIIVNIEKNYNKNRKTTYSGNKKQIIVNTQTNHSKNTITNKRRKYKF